MTTFLLIRHAAHGLLGRTLAGRMAGVSLSPEGRRQAERLADRLAGRDLAALYSSPRERARETAAPLAARLGLAVEVAEALDEIDIGAWTGRGFAELAADEAWRRFNVFRSGTRPPGGESMAEAQLRIAGFLQGLPQRHGDATVGLVSHGDVIKGAVMYVLGMPLDLFLRIEIEPASVTTLELGEDWARVVAINERLAG